MRLLSGWLRWKPKPTGCSTDARLLVVHPEFCSHVVTLDEHIGWMIKRSASLNNSSIKFGSGLDTLRQIFITNSYLR